MAYAVSTVGMTYRVTFSPLSKPWDALTLFGEGYIERNVMESMKYSVGFVICRALYSFTASISRFADNNYPCYSNCDGLILIYYNIVRSLA